MTLNELTDLLPTLTGGVLAIGLILLLLALRLFRRGRKATMWQNRRQAGKRGFRMMLTAIGFLGLSGMLCITTVIFKSLDEEDTKDTTPVAAVSSTSMASPTQTPTSTLTEITETSSLSPTASETATVEPVLTEVVTEEPVSSNGVANPTTSPSATSENTLTATLAPSMTATATITLSASPTATLTSTATDSPSLTPSPSATSTDMPTATVTITPFPTLPSNITPPAAQATPVENISMRVAAISDGLTADFQALSPRDNFETGVRRLYFFLRYRNMNSGILWRPALFKDGEYLDGGSYLWGLQPEGESYFFFGRDTGFEAGDYEIRIYIGEDADPLVTESFTVQ